MPVHLAHLVDGYDVRVVQVRRRLRFRMEPFDLLLAGQLPGEDHLDRHHPVQAHLPRAVHHSHGTPGEFLQQLVIADAAEDGTGGRGCAEQCVVSLGLSRTVLNPLASAQQFLPRVRPLRPVVHWPGSPTDFRLLRLVFTRFQTQAQQANWTESRPSIRRDQLPALIAIQFVWHTASTV